MIAESPLILPESVYTSVSDQRRFFRVNFFLKNVLVIAFSIFCFGISALDLFYLGALFECFLSVGVVESFFCFLYLILFQKIQKYLLIIMHCILHFA